VSSLIHGRHPCKTCPFRVEVEYGSCFRPETLDKTIGSNLRSETYAHNCHSGLDAEHPPLCVGFLRFIRDTETRSQNVVIGERLGLIDYGAISDEVAIAESWNDVLDIHTARLRFGARPGETP